MAVLNTDIVSYLSGGAANSDPNASLGGIISTTAITTATLHNLFDVVSGDESTAGDIEYRCYYVKNNSAQTLFSAVAWINTNTPSTDSSVDIGLGTSAVNGVEQTVVDESTAPLTVSFSAPATKGTGLDIGDIPAGQHKAIWVRRTITAAAVAYDSDSVIIEVGGDTGA